MSPSTPISQQIWDMKYRLKGPDGYPLDHTIEDTWRRIARSLAVQEADPAGREAEFYAALQDFRFLPAGRIVAGAGSGRKVTLFNCFVMGSIPDDMGGIFEHLKQAALTMQQGGGIGYDFSTLRPRGALVRGVGADASGPLSFMDVWDAMCRTIMSAGHRRGAMMATLRCDHPDIEAFIAAKQEPGRLRMFNLSVLITDAFMQAVQDNQPWELRFDGTTYKTLQARELWERIMRATYAYAEPGVIFIDRINRRNNLHYCETISATNPCGEQPLPPYGACLLGSINLAQLVQKPFEAEAALDLAALQRLTETAVRMMDNTIDVSNFPLPQQAEEARQKRRIGLGVTGLADALILCGARYGSPQSLALIETWLCTLRDAAYRASVALAREKGAFPLFEPAAYLAGESIAELPEDIRADIASHGIRNALLTSIAPTGTISLLADNISSGLEPVFAFSYSRNVLMPDGSRREEEVSDYALRLYRRLKGEDAALGEAFVDAQSLAPEDHVRVQAVVQKYIDSSISKTINLPEDIDFEAFKDVYALAYRLGCKGCTTYRPNDVTGAVLSVKKAAPRKAEQAELPLAPARSPLSKRAAASTPPAAASAGGVVYMTRPLDRPEALPGKTYKITWPDSEHAMYITVNDIVQDGRRRPFEMFINSKNTEHYAWTVALTRMISAVFRRGGDVSFVVDELKAVFDPRGGQWMGGRYIPSLLAAIGEVIERHLIDIGFIGEGGGALAAESSERLLIEVAARPEASRAEATIRPEAATPPARPNLRQCPKCGQAALLRQEGCDSCTACGYSKCG